MNDDRKHTHVARIVMAQDRGARKLKGLPRVTNQEQSKLKSGAEFIIYPRQGAWLRVRI